MKRVVLCWFLVCPFVLSVSVLMGGDLSCARWKLKGFVTGRSLFRRPLSGTTFLPTSDTAVSSHSSKLLLKNVPAGSPSRGGDVKVYVLDINQPSLPTPFTLFLRLSLSYGPFTCISFHKFSRQLSVFSPAVGSCGRRN